MTIMWWLIGFAGAGALALIIYGWLAPEDEHFELDEDIRAFLDGDDFEDDE